MPPQGRSPTLDGGLIGRNSLLDDLTAELFEGRGVILRGPAGVGKTVLVRELVSRARTAGRRAALLIATSGMGSVPFGSFLPFLSADDSGAAAGVAAATSWPTVVRTAALAREAVLHAKLDVLAIDDAHLLDAGSVGLLHECAATGVSLVLSIRQGAPAQDALLELWRSGSCRLQDITALGEKESAEFISAVLGGEVDTGLHHHLHRRCGGNPLALRELLLAGVRDGVVVVDRGLWVQRGQLPALPQLADLLRRHLEPLDPATRRVVELVALAEPLPLDLMHRIADATAVENAEASGILTVDDGRLAGPDAPAGMSRATTLRLSHPLYRDATMSALPSLRRRRHYADLLAGVLAADRGERGHRVRADVDRIAIATWQLELGRAVEPAELLRLAELTQFTDRPLCERFLRAAVTTGGGAGALLRLAEVLAHQHQAEAAEQVLQSIDLAPLDEQTAARIAVTRAFLLAMPGQRPGEALIQIDRMITAHGALANLLAVRSTALWRSRQLNASLDQARSVIEDPAAPVDAVAHARLTALSVHMAKANAAALATQIPPTRAATGLASAAIPEGAESIDLIETLLPWQITLDVPGAMARARAGYRRALVAGDDGLRAQFGFQVGWLNMLQGNTDDGVRLLREAAAARGLWCSTTWPWVRSLLVEALVVTGAQDEAAALARSLETARRAAVFEVDISIATAAVVAGDGDLAAAGRAAAGAAAVAIDSGQTALAMTAWYAAMRYGHPDGARCFLETSAATKGVGRVAQRTQARAVLAGDPIALEAAAGLLGAAHLAWFAVEAQAAAVRMFADRGDPLSGAAAQERLRALLARSPGLRPPVLRMLDSPRLTDRESQVAGLAARGMTDRDVAEQLGMSLRTAQTHLARVFGKFGVHSRGELAAILRGLERPGGMPPART